MKLYLVSRSDLPMGLRAAQLCHAVREFQALHPEVDLEWYMQSNTLVLLEVDNEADLTELAVRAEAHLCPVARFREPDLGNALTAVALGPAGKRFTRDLPRAFDVAGP